MPNLIADAVAKMRLFYIRRQGAWYIKSPGGRGPNIFEHTQFYGPYTKAQAIARRTAWAKRLAKGIPINS